MVVWMVGTAAAMAIQVPSGRAIVRILDDVSLDDDARIVALCLDRCCLVGTDRSVSQAWGAASFIGMTNSPRPIVDARIFNDYISDVGRYANAIPCRTCDSNMTNDHVGCFHDDSMRVIDVI